ncbi:Fur family transcriptional regulator [Anaerostipes sp. MSJ-23]|uniref:Fur family transcriptional regulator n=1 Tax=Anaerostipes sp. MSJ-23 TaxID=2841520 RepID=UPI001C112993|nr:transcriptional repressor [Anaerostipes sp. MSJ-23]MBU5460793.1 transcriptional repressor [Anaerostipes sp. MSJ-23]
MQPTLKKSKQRDAIVAFLMTRKDHPTADTIYMNIKKEFPNISLGTVYRNLALLSERGEILKLTYDQGADRYDATVDPHYHFICRECGEVIDLEMDSLDEEVTAMANVKFKGKVEQSVIYFKGICEKCLKKKLDKKTLK